MLPFTIKDLDTLTYDPYVEMALQYIRERI